jgi:CRISPR-associated protein Cmr6
MPPRRSRGGRQESPQGEQRNSRDGEEQKIVWGWPLPKEIRQALKGGVREKSPAELLTELSNPGLLLQRYIPYPKQGPKDRDNVQIFQAQINIWLWKPDKKSFKNDAWRAAEVAVRSLYQARSGAGQLSDCLNYLHTRSQMMKEAFLRQGYQTCTFTRKVAWRLVVGLGLPSPLETGITLHHLYGFPYLPGSAIKGVTRNWRLQQIADELKIPRLSAQQINRWKNEQHYGATPWERLEQLLMTPLPENFKDEKRRREIEKRIRQRYESLQEALGGEYLRTLKELGSLSKGDPELPPLETLKPCIQDFSNAFGNTESKGEIIFFDAFPERLVTEDNEPIVELDVMNPHYGNYYMGKKDAKGNFIPPADWLSPVPVFFLTVRQGTRFIIRLAGRDQNLLNRVEGWVKEALQEFGIGAKTRAGYGELTEASAQSLGGTARATLSAATADPTPSLETAIARWHARDMGTLPQLIEQLSKIPDAARRQQLAHQLQQKLKEAGKWTRNYQSKPWYQTLEKLMGGSPSEPSQS